MEKKIQDWDAETFFRILTATNKLCKQHKFVYCRVSGLQGFEEVLNKAQSEKAFICCSSDADGYTTLNNTPHTRRVKTVFIAMRHAVNRMDLRNICMETMREVFRQFMSVLIREKTKLENNHIYLDSRIQFSEIEQYFAQGTACAYFNIATDIFTDLRFDSEEWDEKAFTEQFNKTFI